MPRDQRLYMTFPNDVHRHPRIRRLSPTARWAFIEIVAATADQNRKVIRQLWSDEIVSELEHCGIVRRHSEGIALVENGLWGIRRPYRKQIDEAVRQEVLRRDGYRCVECGQQSELQMDHIYPWSRGGTDDALNLQTLCRQCNQRKGARV